MSFTVSMALCVKKKFFTNKENKKIFIDMLVERLEQCGNQVMCASVDAYLLIAKAAVEATSKSHSVMTQTY